MIGQVFEHLFEKWQVIASAHVTFVEELNELVYQHAMAGDRSDDLLFIEALEIEPGDDRDGIIDEIRAWMQANWNDFVSAETGDVGLVHDIMQHASNLIDFTKLAERLLGELVDKLLEE